MINLYLLIKYENKPWLPWVYSWIRHSREQASIAKIAAEVENDSWESVMKLNEAHDISAKTLHEDLLLLKKSARCITKMLFKKMKKERVRVREWSWQW
jgi:hypothetical protein